MMSSENDGGKRNLDRLRRIQEDLADMLVGEKIYLKALEREDLPKRVEWINDPVVQRTLHFHYPTSLAKTQKWFDGIVMNLTRRDFSIFARRNNAYIGFGGFVNIDDSVHKADLYATIGEKSYWGFGGYGMDLYQVLVKYGFLELGLNRICGYQLEFNRSARSLVEKLGWKVEGVLRQDVRSHGELKDRVLVTILRSEWIRWRDEQIGKKPAPST